MRQLVISNIRFPQTADVREIIHYPTQLSLTDRNAVHAYMKTRYPELL
ncbi:hypothetical protein GCM10009825_30610 [Arthrobacter humicola]|uniref:Uncharacterized protein n=1 Tax=Arthrobacter humicola TaxID=409291 RepID=A0ABP5L6V8_9MICC